MAGLSETAKGATSLKPLSHHRWGAVALCCGMITICYIDRVNLAVTAPTLMKVFNLSPAEMGVLMSAFFWSYVLVMMPTGWLINKYGPKVMGFWCCFGWGVATIIETSNEKSKQQIYDKLFLHWKNNG